jgi:hypothetical protein
MTAKHYTHGKFIWRDLSMTDVEGSTAFYTALFGWKTEDMQFGDITYRVVKVNDRGIGGIMKPMQPGTPPFWMGHVSCESVDAAATATETAGGKVLVEPVDMQVGRYALAQDPQGAIIGFYHSNDGDPRAEGPPPTGAFCWDSLHTTDLDAAARFYHAVLGWERKPGSGTDVFAIGEGMENMTASLHQTTEGAPPHWLNYVMVEDLAATRQHATKLGGKVLVEEVPVPDIGKFTVLQDPQGAFIAAFQGS